MAIEMAEICLLTRIRNDTKEELTKYQERRKECRKHQAILKEEIKWHEEQLSMKYNKLEDMHEGEGNRVTNREAN